MTPVVLLSPQAYDALIKAARDTQPQEACGLLIGRDEHITQVIPVQNSATDVFHHFEINRQALNIHLPEIRAQGLSIVGFFHSHPHGLPVPSPTDIKLNAHWDHLHIIIGMQGQTPRVAAWRIRPEAVQAVSIVFDEAALREIKSSIWTDTHKIAIIIAALVASTALIILSLNLLPPAP